MGIRSELTISHHLMQVISRQPAQRPSKRSQDGFCLVSTSSKSNLKPSSTKVLCWADTLGMQIEMISFADPLKQKRFQLSYIRAFKCFKADGKRLDGNSLVSCQCGILHVGTLYLHPTCPFHLQVLGN